MTLKLTSGDTAPTLTGIVSANLTGATAVAHIRRPDRTVITKAVTVTDAVTGAWSIAWAAPVVGPPAVRGDLDMTGTHYAEIQVTFSNGQIQTFAVDSAGTDVTFRVREQIA